MEAKSECKGVRECDGGSGDGCLTMILLPLLLWHGCQMRKDIAAMKHAIENIEVRVQVETKAEDIPPVPEPQKFQKLIWD